MIPAYLLPKLIVLSIERYATSLMSKATLLCCGFAMGKRYLLRQMVVPCCCMLLTPPPSLIFSLKVEKYQGSRTHEDFKAFVERMRKDSEPEAKPNVDNEDGKVPTVAGSPVVQLVEANFENGIASGISFIKFYAPWCGHCKRMAPTWEELGTKFVGSTDVKIAKVDCTEASNRQLCASQKVSGFPTMIIYKNGVKIDEYDGNRSLEDMHSFVTRNAGHDEL